MKYVYQLNTEVHFKEGRPMRLDSIFRTKKDALKALEFECHVYADDLTGESDPIVSSDMSKTYYFKPHERQLKKGAKFVARSVERKELY